jgi:hypothetical protein
MKEKQSRKEKKRTKVGRSVEVLGLRQKREGGSCHLQPHPGRKTGVAW